MEKNYLKFYSKYFDILNLQGPKSCANITISTKTFRRDTSASVGQKVLAENTMKEHTKYDKHTYDAQKHTRKIRHVRYAQQNSLFNPIINTINRKINYSIV